MVRVLVPVRVLEGQTVSPGVIDLLSPATVVLLGYHVVPDQTTPSQARMSFEEKAQQKLKEIGDAFRDAGAEVETRLVFTGEGQQTIERIAEEEGCNATLYLNPSMEVKRVLIALRGAVNADRIGTFTAALVGDRDIEVTILEVVSPAGEAEDPSDLARRAQEGLADHGSPDAEVRVQTIESDRPVATIVEAAVDYDAIVMGEKAQSLSELLFGDIEERIAEESLGPVLVVRGTAKEETWLEGLGQLLDTEDD